jgi:eukaryotic-like serine/threonine-protein kinase
MASAEQMASPRDNEGASSPRWRFDEREEIAPGLHAVKRLGGGHRYDAYLAWDDHLHALVVVKVVRPHLVEDAHTLAGLAGEVELLERLDHPVLVRSFRAAIDSPRPHVVLEHLEGPRLSTLLRRYGPLPLDQLLPLALQVCSVLHYLAEEGVVHLDVKPSNIIMGAPPRLIDLSVAMDAADAARLDHHVGTDAYMAPEQCDPVAIGGVGPPADVWGLGATLYRAATGERAFSDPGADHDPPEIRWPQLVEKPRPLDDRLTTAVAFPLMSTLERDPADRSTAAELAAILEPVFAAMPGPRLSRLKPRL